MKLRQIEGQTQMKAKYLSCAETAKLVRAALKRTFPGVKFSVKSRTYAGGASIDCYWTDGPCARAVEAVTGQFRGANFDGMIDMKTSFDSWLSPDGTAIVASDPGTQGSSGVLPPERNWMPDPDAKLVRFGANFIFCTRTTTANLLRRVRARLEAKGLPAEVVEIVEYSDGGGYAKITSYDETLTRGFDMQREMNIAAANTYCVKAAT